MGEARKRLRVPDWLRRLLTEPVEELTRWQRTVRWGIELARHCARELAHDKAGQMAAALTYHTLFSILPILVLVLVGLNAFAGPQEREAFKTWVVERTVAVLQGEDLDLDEEGGEPGGGEGDDAPTTGDLRSEFEAFRLHLDQQLQAILESLERVSFRSIGLVGVLIFIFGATELLSTVERSFNGVFGVTSGRSLFVRLPIYYTVISLGPIVVLMGQYLKGRLLGFIEAGAWTAWLAGPAALAAPILATWLVLYLMYVLLPTARVSKRAAGIGSLVAAILLAITREIFRLYVAKAAITSLYGALALLPLSLLFLWLMWLLVLFGLELTYTIGALGGGRQLKSERYKLHDHQLIDPTWMVPLAMRVARAFEGGKTCSADALGREANLPQPVVVKLLEALQRAGMVNILSGSDRVPEYALARPASSIRVAELLEAGRNALAPMPGHEKGGPAWSLLEEMETACAAVAGDFTLADLAGDPPGDQRTP